MVEIQDVQGLGYALSSPAELETIRLIAQTTGVVLDPVYSGKAMCGLLDKMKHAPESFQGRDVLFWHTGGIFGVFEKAPEFAPLFDESGVRPMPPL